VTAAGAALPELRGRRVRLRAHVGEPDIAALARILREPAVARWWHSMADPDRVRADLVDAEPGWVIEVGGACAGWIQFYEETEPDYRHVALDLFLAGAHHGQGLGREAVRLVIDHFAARGHHRFTIDPAADNERAIRSYAALGFRPVGVLRAYERGADGTWHDGLLMDLLVSDLAPAS
jgi:aminoglycoside 6'-N-acetyltransferase